MAAGKGVYDDVATLVRKKTNGRMVVVMVWDGDKGSGFSVQTDSPSRLNALPAMLRDMAGQLEPRVKGDVQ